VADRQALNQGSRRDVQADHVQVAARLGLDGAVVDEPPALAALDPGKCWPDIEVLGQVQFLVDQSDAQIEGGVDGVDQTGLSSRKMWPASGCSTPRGCA